MAQHALPYYQAARFKNKSAAGATYDKLQQLIFIEDCDLSVYRFKLNTYWHVVVIGEKPSDSMHFREPEVRTGDAAPLSASGIWLWSFGL